MLSRRPLKIGLINIRSIRNKLCFVSETLQEHDLDLLCITETWLLSCAVATVGASLPGSYSFLHVPRLTATKGGGVGLIYRKALSSMKMVANQIEVVVRDHGGVFRSLPSDIQVGYSLSPWSPGYRSDFYE